MTAPERPTPLVRRSRPRFGLLLLVAAATVVTVATVTTKARSAQAGGTTLHLVARLDKHVGFQPSHRPRQGDRVGFGHTISGDASGSERSVCTLIGGSALCIMQLQLARGTLTAQGMVPQRARNTPVSITGGTGTYSGARGTATVTDLTPTRSAIVITLLP